MEKKVLASNIQDDGQTRPYLCDVSKILLGANAQIDPVMDTKAPETSQNLQVRGLIGNQIVGIEKAGVFGKAMDEATIFGIRKTSGSLPRNSYRRAKPEKNRAKKESENQSLRQHREP